MNGDMKRERRLVMTSGDDNDKDIHVILSSNFINQIMLRIIIMLFDPGNSLCPLKHNKQRR